MCNNGTIMKRAPFKSAGFTIVELLIVVVVIAILAAVIIVSYNGITSRANESAAKASLHSVVTRLELDKAETGSFPLTLALADGGKGVPVAPAMSLEYNSTGETYCLTVGSLKDQKNYYQTSQASVTLGICPGHRGYIAGAGIIQSGSSIFGAAAPTGNYAVYNDGGGGLWVGNRFYTYENNGIRVLGLRVWEPTSATSTFLTQNIDARAYVSDWQGSTLPGWSGLGSTVATATYASTRTAGSWTNVWFPVPFTIKKVTSTAAGGDMVNLAVKYRGGSYDGSHYVAVSPAITSQAINSVVMPGTYLTEQYAIGRSISTAYPTDSLDTYYGIDLLFEKL